LPTGLVESRQGRKRDNNLKDAKSALLEILKNAKNGQIQSTNSSIRKSQLGAGCRGDKTFTIRFQDDQAICHANGKTTTSKKYMKGFMDELWS